jgi:hypothetical protein
VGIQNSVQDGWIVPESQIILPSSEEEEWWESMTNPIRRTTMDGV